MNVSTIIDLLHAECFTKMSVEQFTHQVESAFASDLMSDVLAYVNEDTLLMTGLSQIQSLRTAEMLDIKYILYVRGKKPNQEMVELAQLNQMTLIGTSLTMYEASGILYHEGLAGLHV